MVILAYFTDLHISVNVYIANNMLVIVHRFNLEINIYTHIELVKRKSSGKRKLLKMTHL